MAGLEDHHATAAGAHHGHSPVSLSWPAGGHLRREAGAAASVPHDPEAVHGQT